MVADLPFDFGGIELTRSPVGVGEEVALSFAITAGESGSSVNQVAVLDVEFPGFQGAHGEPL